MPILLLLGLLATAASTRQEDSVILLTGGCVDATYDNRNYTGLFLSSTEVLSNSCPVPSLPLPLLGHATVLTADGLILTCGGEEDGFNDNIFCFVLDTRTDTWLYHSNLHRPRGLFSYVSLPLGVYLLGGEGEREETSSSFLPTGSTQWQDGPTLRNGVFGSCAFPISDSSFLVIGGAPDPKQVEEFDTLTNSWSSWPPLQPGRFFHSCARAGDNIVIVGGVDSDDHVVSSTTILNIKDKSQRPGGNMSMARDIFQMLSHEDKVFAIGGDKRLDFGDYTGPGLNLVEEWNETTEDWEVREDLRMETNRLLFGAVSAPKSKVCANLQ